MSDLKAILFDLDGTLLDSTDDIADAINFALHECGLANRSREEVRYYIGDGMMPLIERAVGDRSSPLISKCADLFRKYYAEHCIDKSYLYDGVLETVEKLKKNYKLAIVTNKDETFSKLILKGLQIEHLFDELIGGNTLQEKKPSTVSISYLSEKWDLDKNCFIMIGDHVTDLELAKRAGIPGIFCTFGIGRKENLPSHRDINHFSELIDIVSNFNYQQFIDENKMNR